MGLNLLSKFNKKTSKNQIKVDLNEHSPGVITQMSQADLDSQTKQDASGFVIEGGKKKKRTRKKRTRKRRSRRRKTRKRRSSKRKNSKKRRR